MLHWNDECAILKTIFDQLFRDAPVWETDYDSDILEWYWLHAYFHGLCADATMDQIQMFY